MKVVNYLRGRKRALKHLPVVKAFLFLFYSCNHPEAGVEGEPASYMLVGDTLVLAENSTIGSRLTISLVGQHDFITELATAGVVNAIPTNYAEIAPPVAGRVVESYVKLGQQVNVGTPLFAINSTDYFNAQKDYFNAKQERRNAELNLKRQQDLLKNGVGAQRELENAETAFFIAESAYSQASAALNVFNTVPEKTVLGQPLVVVSPIRGEILTNKIVIGQYLKEDTESLAVVGELSNVWVVAHVKEKDVGLLPTLAEVEVRSDAYPDRVVKGEIHHINEIVNEATRSVELLVACSNAHRELKPGMYVNVLFKGRPQTRLSIPSTSVFQQEGRQFVFVKKDATRFEKRTIETGDGAGENVRVTSGLRAGEEVVSEGGFLMIRNY